MIMYYNWGSHSSLVYWSLPDTARLLVMLQWSAAMVSLTEGVDVYVMMDGPDPHVQKRMFPPHQPPRQILVKHTLLASYMIIPYELQ